MSTRVNSALNTELTGFRRWERFIAQIALSCDIGCGLAMIWAATALRSQLVRLGWAVGVQDAPLTGAVCLWLLTLALLIRGRLRRSSAQPRPLTHLVQAFALSVLVTFAALFLWRGIGTRVSRPSLAVYALLAVGTLAFIERVLRMGMERDLHPRAACVVVVGPGEEVNSLLLQLSRSPGIVARGIACDRAESPAAAAQDCLEEIYECLRAHAVDEVLLTADLLRVEGQLAALCRQVAGLCEETGVHLGLWANWLPSHGTVYLDFLGARPVLTYAFRRASHWGLFSKRCLDLALGVPMFALTLPVIAVAALAVKLDSPGPALYRQDRCGMRGRPFKIYKLRSMCSGAEALESSLRGANDLQGPAFKLSNDRRVTRVGRFLRRSSIDELPQLWNVIRGDMSLVGPRPAPVSEVARYVPGHFRKMAMKPGITGLWQVSGRTSVVDFESRVGMDSAYISNWSIWLDLKILARTVIAVARLSGV